MLVDAFNEDQSERYELWRRVKLKKEIVRKITNQTLSQSVPPSVIITINASTKVFIGQLIDMARTVQAEWQRTRECLKGPLLPDHLREALRRYKK
ncbi:TAFII28-like protein, partial [Patellaria atrata CBS 101060]